MSSVHSSVILQTRDEKIYVVPRSLLTYWEVFSSLEEATGNSDDVISIPLSSGQVDIWLDLTVRLEVDWLQLTCRLEEEEWTDVVLPLLPQNEATTIARSMDAKNTDWYAYCRVEEEGKSDEELKIWYKEVGDLYVDYLDKMEWDSGDCWYDTLVDAMLEKVYIGDNDHYQIVLGILRCSEMEAQSQQQNMAWTQVDWNMIVRLGVSITVASCYGGVSADELIPSNVLILCYDGVHNPPVPHPVAFSWRHKASIIVARDCEEELYVRTMRCVIVMMEKYPEDISSIAKAINIDDNSDPYHAWGHLAKVIETHKHAITDKSLKMIESRVGREGALLFKKAKTMYLRSELKRYEEMEVT